VTDEALAAANARAMPAVARRPSRYVVPAAIGAVALLGIGTFAALYHPARTPDATGDFATTPRPPSTSADLPPPPVLASPAPPVASPPITIPSAPPVRVQPVQLALPPRPATPALLVDLTAGEKPGDAGAAKIDAAAAPKLSANESFLERVTHARPDTVGIDRMSSTDLVIPQGTIITGVLETAINSDLPGLVRAVVSRDVRGFDATKVLIPRGSRLVGQYSSGVALGQSRAFVIWTRLIRSDGVSVELGSAATDPLGTAGLGGKVNSHFLRRFGAATLLSVITSGLDYLVTTAQSAGSVNVQSPSQATQLAGVALQRDIDIPPTIKVPQGTPVRVFVAKDLDFAAGPGKK
jgi:type IV secretion system protein VirB10